MTGGDPERAGAALARRLLLRWRRPLNDDLVALMGPAMRRGFEGELERLGVCAGGAHVWEPGRIRAGMPAEILEVRALGEEIETCLRCGVWRDKGGRR